MVANRDSSFALTDTALLFATSAYAQSGQVLAEAAASHWDTELRVRKTLVFSDALELAVVGEAFNLLNLNRGAEPTRGHPF